jgi:hypothetical protein
LEVSLSNASWAMEESRHNEHAEKVNVKDQVNQPDWEKQQRRAHCNHFWRQGAPRRQLMLSSPGSVITRFVQALGFV